MIRKLICAAALLWLGACDRTAESPPPPPKHEGPRHIPWLSVEPHCGGSIGRAEWLVCENKALGDLHRRLARQWEDDRRTASRERRKMLELQLRALLAERAQCTDAACVAAAYRRYLAGSVAPLPAPQPSWTPAPRPRPTARPRPQQRPSAETDGEDRADGGSRYWYRGAGERSCAAEIGSGAAARLSRQCAIVTPGQGRGGQCSVRRTCASLRDQVDQGCWDARRKPGFCRR